jgi:hypothetical protein
LSRLSFDIDFCLSLSESSSKEEVVRKEEVKEVKEEKPPQKETKESSGFVAFTRQFSLDLLLCFQKPPNI